MQIKRVVKAVLLVAVWAYAGATWGSIGHHLVGLPDLTPLAALGLGVGAAVWIFRPAPSAVSAQRSRIGNEDALQAR